MQGLYRFLLLRRGAAVRWAIAGISFALVLACANSLAAEVTRTGANAEGNAMEASDLSYLEDPKGARARAWVESQNARTTAELEDDPRFARYLRMANTVLSGSDAKAGNDASGLLAAGLMWMYQGNVYQLWSDAAHPRGLWRRSSLVGFLDKKPDWTVLLDIDALSVAEGDGRTLAAAYFSPNGRRCLLLLSLGGSIRSVWREFDLERREFVQDGFQAPASTILNMVVWRTDDSVLISADFGPGTLSTAAIPLTVREWRRGQALADAAEIFRGRADDIGVVVATVDADDGGTLENERGVRTVHLARMDKQRNFEWWRLDDQHSLSRLQAPLSNTNPILYKDQYLIRLRGDWRVGPTVWKAGDVVAVPASDIARPDPRVKLVFAPEKDASAVSFVAKSRSAILFFGSTLGHSRLWRSTFKDGSWSTDLVPLPKDGRIVPGAADIRSDVAFIHYESFLHPPSLYRLDVADNWAAPFATGAEEFDASALTTELLQVRSADGAQVPYSIVRPRNLKVDGSTPTLIVAYGASGGTSLPYYSGTLGKLWLEQGGAYVLANVRGGQERGLDWAVKGVDRQHTYDDLVAVTEDLIARHVTSKKRVGFMGHSAGGLLGGVMLTQRPDLFGAVVLKAPFLDQFRLDLVMLGPNAWAREFGSPEIPAERKFLERTSPFQNLRADARLPKPFLITSTTDETVSPAHARRFAARMECLKEPFLFYETSDGGHGLVNTPADEARLEALIYVYLARQLLVRSGELD
jgi:prolyl oligopeptidase